MHQILDPAGRVRGTAKSADPEDFLRIAWGMGPRDHFTVLLTDEGVWELHIYRADRIPAIVTLAVRTGFVADADVTKTRHAMIEAAWLDLVDDGWTVSQNPQG